MTKKDSSGEQQSPVPPNREIQIPRPVEGATDQAAIAQALVNLPVEPAITMSSHLQPPFDSCLNELTIELAQQIKAVNAGNLNNVEGLLVTQAYTLNTIFHRLAQRANGQEYLDNFGMILKLALRAQSQCARTLETLANIRNPVNTTYIRQTNSAVNQQINNSHPTDPQQLEHTHGNYLDTGTATAGIRENPATTTVAQIKRSQDSRRQN